MSVQAKQVRFGIVGMGVMGSAHARWIADGNVKGATLGAVCDAVSSTAMQAFADAAHFTSPEAMFTSGTVDAVLIATPHYTHVSLSLAALEAGLHVMVEKPIAVDKADAERLSAVKLRPGQVFGAMFCMRTLSVYAKIKALIDAGELGQVRRINWVATDWFRSHAYYASGGWRATWEGEGGGVLINQCPHNLDLWQWFFGMPQKIFARCQFGRYHDIEVEDDVTALFQYEDGKTGVFVCSTGEAPGTNRLEITGERGRVVLEGGRLSFQRNEVPVSEYSRTTPERTAKPAFWEIQIPYNPDTSRQHINLTQNFVDSILNGTPLLAPAQEGIRSVELANAMLLSAWQNREVTLPIDGAEYARQLQLRIEESRSRRSAQ